MCTTPGRAVTPTLSSHSVFMAAKGAEGARGQQALLRVVPCCQSSCLGLNIGSFCSGKQQVNTKEENIFTPHMAHSTRHQQLSYQWESAAACGQSAVCSPESQSLQDRTCLFLLQDQDSLC